MNLSYWEKSSFLADADYVIVGAGIVGLFAAITLKKAQPSARVVLLERSFLPSGASTKNAGFACFGSISEIIDDLKTHTEEEVIQLIQKRYSGLQLLRKNLGDAALDFKPFGGYELFLKEDESFYEQCMQKMPFINELLQPHFKADVFSKQGNQFQFSGITDQLVFNPFEAQIDTGNMMQALLKKAHQNDILILNSQNVTHHQELNDAVEVATNGITFKTNKLIFTTNGFAGQLTHHQVQPARAQV
jgi:glycine/D-amino acid oxidase-like deaminating enzyme